MNNWKIQSGKIGEAAAARFLSKKGYKILELNFKIRYGELDIIATYKDTLVFVEVKTRSSSEFGTPLESITPWKLKSVIKSAQVYKLSHPKLPELLRIDAVSVTINPNGSVGEIEHVENITG